MPQKNKASVLVYSLVILSVMLLIALAMTTSSITDLTTYQTSAKSNQALQVADSGLNKAATFIKENATGKIKDLGACTEGKVIFDIAGGKCEITFYDSAGSLIKNCETPCFSVARIKSIGKFGGTARALDVQAFH